MLFKHACNHNVKSLGRSGAGYQRKRAVLIVLISNCVCHYQTTATIMSASLKTIPPEVLLEIIKYLDRTSILRLSCVCLVFETFFQRQKLFNTWKAVKKSACGNISLEPIPRLLLFDICCWCFGVEDQRTQSVLPDLEEGKYPLFNKLPLVIEELLEVTFRKYGFKDKSTQLLLQYGAVFKQVSLTHGASH